MQPQSDHENQAQWNSMYAPSADGTWPLPPWCELDCDDLGEFLSASPLDFSRIHTVLDMGAGYGLRTMIGLAMTTDLNRPDVHAVCVDIAQAAIDRGMTLWESVRLGRIALPTRSPLLPPLRCSMTFRRASAASLPEDVLCTNPDLVIDWMMLHGLPKPLWQSYLASVIHMRPRYILLKCFSSEHGTLTALPDTVSGVTKYQLSDADVSRLFNGLYRVVGTCRDWPEELKPSRHSDGPIGAKRAYCFERV
jgi:hypothetical protein